MSSYRLSHAHLYVATDSSLLLEALGSLQFRAQVQKALQGIQMVGAICLEGVERSLDFRLRLIKLLGFYRSRCITLP